MPTRSIYSLRSAFKAKSITILCVCVWVCLACLVSPIHTHTHKKPLSIPLRSGYFIYTYFSHRDEISHLWFIYPHTENDRLSPLYILCFGFAKKKKKSAVWRTERRSVFSLYAWYKKLFLCLCFFYGQMVIDIVFRMHTTAWLFHETMRHIFRWWSYVFVILSNIKFFRCKKCLKLKQICFVCILFIGNFSVS